jgi:rod shape determining protein RodA
MVQVISFIIGITAALIISKIDYELICRLWPFLSGISIFLVLLTFTSLGLKVADDQAWLRMPIIGTFQPSELLKITFIISFATHLSKVHDKINEFRTVFLLCIHGAIPVLLVFKQGDDGTALVFLCIFVSMLFLAGLRPIYFFIGATGGASAVPVVWQLMDEQKKARFLCLIFIEKYANNVGWQQNLALIAIGSGRLWGLGFLKGGNQYLYARNNDFIFTVAGEEFGFVGGLALFAVLALVLLALFREIIIARDLQGMLLCGGVMSMIGFQSIINLGMNLRIMPVIGITLPFFSRGGSSLVTLYLGIGLALSVYYSSKTRVHDTIFSKKH